MALVLTEKFSKEKRGPPPFSLYHRGELLCRRGALEKTAFNRGANHRGQKNTRYSRTKPRFKKFIFTVTFSFREAKRQNRDVPNV